MSQQELLHSTKKLVAFTVGGFLLGTAANCLLKKVCCSLNMKCPVRCNKTQGVSSNVCEKKSDQAKVERYACIEFGGTTIRLAIGIKETTSNGQINQRLEEQMTIDTANPEQNMQQIKDFFEGKVIDRVGVASFGPICLDQQSEQYGYITTTPKQLWRNYNLVNSIKASIPHRKIEHIGFETDVNTAALAEYNINHKNKSSLAYITIGTGVGVGLIINNKTVHGLTHPEGGHILVKPYPDEKYKGHYNLFKLQNNLQRFLSQSLNNGVCARHGDCVEGLVTNHALAERLQTTIHQLSAISDSDSVWEHVAFYIAQLCLNLTLLCSPEVIVIGGGIMNRGLLLNQIRQHFIKLLNGYVEHPKLGANISEYIVKTNFHNAGLEGTMFL